MKWKIASGFVLFVSLIGFGFNSTLAFSWSRLDNSSPRQSTSQILNSSSTDFWGQFHETKLSVCFLSAWEETYAQPKNMEKSFNWRSEKFHQVEFSSEFLLYKIDPWSFTRVRSSCSCSFDMCSMPVLVWKLSWWRTIENTIRKPGSLSFSWKIIQSTILALVD